jgi:hypothetical protein
MLVNLTTKSVVYYINDVEVGRVENVAWVYSGTIYVVCIVQLEGKSIDVIEVV